MNDRPMLTLYRLPARLDVHQTAELLGFMDHDITILVRAKLLKPLGDPAPNGHKFFSSSELQVLVEDRQWLDKATKAVARHWQAKNDLARCKEAGRPPSPAETTAAS